MGRSLALFSLSLPRSLSPGFRPQATAHVLLQILVKKLKWIHEWSDGTHGVSAVAKCATIRIAASSPLVRASVVRLTTTRHHRGRGRIFLRFSTDDWSRLFAYPSTFLFFFFPSLLLSLPFDSYLSKLGGIILSTKKNW